MLRPACPPLAAAARGRTRRKQHPGRRRPASGDTTTACTTTTHDVHIRAIRNSEARRWHGYPQQRRDPLPSRSRPSSSCAAAVAVATATEHRKTSYRAGPALFQRRLSRERACTVFSAIALPPTWNPEDWTWRSRESRTTAKAAVKGALTSITGKAGSPTPRGNITKPNCERLCCEENRDFYPTALGCTQSVQQTLDRFVAQQTASVYKHL